MQCALWNVLGPLNNWRLISITDKEQNLAKHSSEVTQKLFRDTLKDRSFSLMSRIVEGNYGAIPTTDPKATSGYYVFLFRSQGYILQNGITTNSERIPSGALVCDITWLNAVPKSSRLYSHGFKDDTSLDSIIRIQQIVDENVTFSFVTSRDMLSSSIRPMFKELLEKNTIIVDDECHHQIIENIAAIDHLDYDEYFSSTDNSNDYEDTSEDEDDM